MGGFETTGEISAVEAGHHVIGHHHIDLQPILESRDPFGGAVGLFHLVAKVTDHLRGCGADDIFVVD